MSSGVVGTFVVAVAGAAVVVVGATLDVTVVVGAAVVVGAIAEVVVADVELDVSGSASDRGAGVSCPSAGSRPPAGSVVVAGTSVVVVVGSASFSCVVATVLVLVLVVSVALASIVEGLSDAVASCVVAMALVISVGLASASACVAWSSLPTRPKSRCRISTLAAASSTNKYPVVDARSGSCGSDASASERDLARTAVESNMRSLIVRRTYN